MLLDKPDEREFSVLQYALKLATSDLKYFTLQSAQKLNFFQFYSLDIFLVIVVTSIVFIYI